MKAGKPTQQQADNEIVAGTSAPNDTLEANLLQTQDEKEGADGMVLSYLDSFKFCSDNASLSVLEEALFMKFPGILGPKPLPARQEALKKDFIPRENFGLFVDRADALGSCSLFKMEQRLVLQGVLDRAAVAELTTSSAAGFRLTGPMKSPIKQLLFKADAVPTTAVPTQGSLDVGNLPTVTEAPEVDESQLQQQPQINSTLNQPDAGSQPGQPHVMPTTGVPQLEPAGLGTYLLGGAPQPLMQIVVMPNGSLTQVPLAPEPPLNIAPLRWLDDSGLMIYEPQPLKAYKERPWRRYDQDKENTSTYRRLPIVENAGEQSGEGSQTYRLDIELSRLEFHLHPGMAKEDLLAARLLAAFREFKRRESVGLVSYFANKLAALEEALLGSREKLFDASSNDAAEDAELLALYNHTQQIEKEVAETRQLKEEEEVLMWRAANAMQLLYGEIMQLREAQGYWGTNVQLTVLQKPPEEMLWSMGIGVSRDRLDLELLMAEEELIVGLPPAPFSFPVPHWDLNPVTGGLGLFRPRRLETMCSAHKSQVDALKKRLEVLEMGPHAEGDANIALLRSELMLLGLAPKRVARSQLEQQQARQHAMERLSAGEVGVLRVPVLNPILSVKPDLERKEGSDSQGNLARNKAAVKHPRYYAMLYVNGKLLGASEVATMDDDYVITFKDTFSVQVVRWPHMVSLQIWEKGAIRDTYVSEVYIAIPGLAGSPHVDSQAKSYQFTSQTPFRAKPSKESAFAHSEITSPGVGAIKPAAGPGGAANPPNLVYPTGVMVVRCGWVAEQAAVAAGVEVAVLGARSELVSYNNPLADRAAASDDVEAGRSFMPPLPHLTVDRVLRKAAERVGVSKATRAQLLSWLNSNKIDPNDPRNAALMELLKAQEAQNGTSLGGLFRLDVPPAVSLSELRMHSKRFNFLTRRWGSGQYRDPERCVLRATRSVRAPVTLSERDTESLESLYLDSLNLFEMAPGGVGQPVSQALMARQERAVQMQSGPNIAKAIEDREKRLTNFANRIHAAAVRLAGGKQARRKFTTDDVIKDVALPEWKLNWVFWSWSIWDERRPLKPVKREIGRNEGLPFVPEDLELLVSVERCTNLPARNGSPAQQGLGSNDEDGDLQSSESTAAQMARGLQCFVEVVYRTTMLKKDESGRTMEEERVIRRRTASTQLDDFPVFNEQLSLPVFGPGLEATSAAINETNNFITINVFDEYINNHTSDLRAVRRGDDEISDPVKFPERERRFLGCIRMPLSAVYQMQVLEGIFKLDSPPVILGYHQASDRPPCIHLSLALRPHVVPPSLIEEERINGEAEDIAVLAQRWQSNVLALPLCKRRVIRAMGIDSDGTSILVTRFLSPTPLPPAIAQLASNPDAIAADLPQISITELVMLKISRFVSLIPYVEDSSLAKRRSDIWCTTSEFMYLTAGDSEEHAHLLAGYFLEIGQQALIVLGASLLGGRSAFVLTTGQASFDPNNSDAPPPNMNFDESKLRLWNPLTGVCSSVKDPTCEMRQVGTIYDHTNMWANKQWSHQPWEMEWQLGSTKIFEPFFGRYLPQRELATLQVSPAYEELSDQFYEELGRQAEESARDAIQKARGSSGYVTKPDNKISRLLKELLMQIPSALERVAMASLGASLILAEAPSDTPGEAPARLGERHKLISQLQEKHNEEIIKQSKADLINGHILALPFSDRYVFYSLIC
ncbi:hypothetical protein CEUSTIGMA_g3929.t1 [Chlamydomonas eustigma]|uniref:Uncharacterized protein n=1 Tax=Chlamydomonas eustigma TaxID=1157962 RepID=A0A250X063_9CHLO|nr:hypothetical protein CEUSTIGMA_g3929.t1 [Chlamydomonas eustigma]|eukprot:GAX76484.1 hypothetical protein CEUSTIGMA_g3929.t1 [Chlamydomonas eustigma]